MAAAEKPERTADIRTLKKYVDLENHRSKIEDELKSVKAQLADLEAGVLLYFERQGLDRATLDGRTLYLRRDLYAGREEGVDAERAIEALEAAGFGDYVKRGIVTVSLSALFREREKDGEPAVPAALVGVMVANEVFRVGSRKA